jgi:hypothetical protein
LGIQVTNDLATQAATDDENGRTAIRVDGQ